MWAKVKSAKVEKGFLCIIYPKVTVVWHLPALRSPGLYVFSSTPFLSLLPDHLLLPGEGELPGGVWTLNPANTQLHSSGYHLSRSRSKKPARRHSQALRKMDSSRCGLRDQQNPLVDAVFVINDIPPKPQSTGLLHQHPVRGHLL